MRKKRRKIVYGKHKLPKGFPVKMKGILLEQDFVYIPKKYIGQQCKIKYEDRWHFHCFFKDGFHMWIPKGVIKITEISNE